MGILRRLATRQAVIIILILDLLIFVGIYFTRDNTVTLAIMLGVSAGTAFIFFFIMVYIRFVSGYEGMYSTIKNFVMVNPDTGIHLFDRDGPLHEIHPEEITPSDLISLKGGHMRKLADKPKHKSSTIRQKSIAQTYPEEEIVPEGLMGRRGQ
jgi:hypothetical protein